MAGRGLVRGLCVRGAFRFARVFKTPGTNKEVVPNSTNREVALVLLGPKTRSKHSSGHQNKTEGHKLHIPRKLIAKKKD